MFSYTKTGIDVIDGKVLILGDSISQNGQYVSFLHTYFKLYHPERNLEFINLGICGETLSGLSEPNRQFPRPCIHNRIDRILETIQPAWVICCYGMNDGIYHPLNDDFFQAFKDGYLSLINKIHTAGAKVIALTPPPFDSSSYPGELTDDTKNIYGHTKPYQHYDQVLETYALWMINHLSSKADILVDLHGNLKQYIQSSRQQMPTYQYGDGIHPNVQGHFVMAHTLLREAFNIHTHYFGQIMQQDNYQFFTLIHQLDCLKNHYTVEKIGHDHPSKLPYLEGPALQQALVSCTQKISDYITTHPQLSSYMDEWHGYEKKIFFFEGYEVTFVAPVGADTSKPWIWRTEFFGAFPMVDLAMAQKGYHLIHINLTDQYGSPATIQIMKRFQDFISLHFSLHPQCILFGFSRGGLYARHYAALFPQKVHAIYLDAPVVDIKSWPGGFGVGKGAPCEWIHCTKIFSTVEDLGSYYTNLINADLDKLTQAQIPMIIVAGDSDHVVPYEENGQLIADYYTSHQIPIVCILKAGIDHHPHSLDDPTPIVDFLEQTLSP